MKNLLLSVAAVGLMAGVGIASASTCELAGTPVTVDQVQSGLESQGYMTSKKVKMHNCVYQVSAQDSSKKTWTLYFDPLTGNMIGKKS